MGTVAVFGLGSMGFGIADSLRVADHNVYGLDVVPASVEKFAAGGGLTGQPQDIACLLYTSPSPRDLSTSRMPSSA